MSASRSRDRARRRVRPESAALAVQARRVARDFRAVREIRGGRPSIASVVQRDPQMPRASRSAEFHGLRANIAPVCASISVTTKGADAPREVPSTHSTYAVTESRRRRAEVLRIRNREILMGSSSGTIHQQIERDLVRVMLEASCSLARDATWYGALVIAHRRDASVPTTLRCPHRADTALHRADR